MTFSLACLSSSWKKNSFVACVGVGFGSAVSVCFDRIHFAPAGFQKSLAVTRCFFRYGGVACHDVACFLQDRWGGNFDLCDNHFAVPGLSEEFERESNVFKFLPLFSGWLNLCNGM